MKITKTRLKQIIKEEISAQQIKRAKEMLAQGLISKEEYQQMLNPQKKKAEPNLSGPTTAGQPEKSNDPLSGQTTVGQPDKANAPLAGQTTADQPQDVKKKAVALDQVEALLAKLLKQIQQL
jgi:hypothetical protein